MGATVWHTRTLTRGCYLPVEYWTSASEPSLTPYVAAINFNSLPIYPALGCGLHSFQPLRVAIRYKSSHSLV